MKYLLLGSCVVAGLLTCSLAAASTAEEQRHLESLRQQEADAQVQSGRQSKIKRLKQKEQGAISYPLMEEMAKSARRNKLRRSPDERGLWSLLHSGNTSALNNEISRLRKLYPHWTPPSALVSGGKEVKTGRKKNYDLAVEQYQSGNHAAALSLLKDESTPAARELRGNILFDQGLIEYRSKNFQNASGLWLQAMENGRVGRDVQLMQAWTDLNLGHDSAALQRFVTLYQDHPDEDVAQGVYRAALASGNQEQVSQWMNQDPNDPLRRLVLKDRSEFLKQQGWIWAARSSSLDVLPELEGIQGPWLDVAAAARSKTGDSGQSRLQINMLPAIEMQYARGNDVLQFRLTHLSLDSGSFPVDAWFGSYHAAGSYVAQPTTESSGWMPNLRWRHEGDGQAYQMSLGTTPTGSPVGVTPTGEIMSEHITEQAGWRAAAYRSSVRDSLLSAVGAIDPYSGLAWGRVLRNGVRAEVNQMVGSPWSVNANIRAERIDGENVASNTRVAGGIGLGYDMGMKNFSYFTVGPGIDYDHYANNLSHFTWGHGGYFSPQSFVNAGMAVRFLTQEGGRSLMRGQLSVGLQHIAEDAASCFPLAPAIAQANCAGYEASSKQGVGASVEGLWRYVISPSWQLGGALILRYSQDYSDASVLLTLRYNWNGRRALYRTDLPEGMLGDLY